MSLLESDRLMLATPAKHRLARKRTIVMDDLRDEPLIQYAAGQVPGLHAITLRVFEQARLVPRVSQEAVQVQTVLSLVASGLGVALVPSASYRSSGAVALRAIKDLPEAGTIGISLAHFGHSMTVAARRFHELALHDAEEASRSR